MMNLFLVSFPSIILFLTYVTCPYPLSMTLPSGCIRKLKNFSMEIESESIQKYSYAAVYEDVDKDEQIDFVVLAKKNFLDSYKPVFKFGRSTIVVLYLSERIMKTMSKHKRDSGLVNVFSGFKFEKQIDATEFFDEIIVNDATQYINTYECLQILVVRNGGDSDRLVNGGTIIRAEIAKKLFTYSVKSSDNKTVAIFSTGDYRTQLSEDGNDSRLKIVTRVVLGAYKETKTYILTFRLAAELKIFRDVLSSDNFYLNKAEPVFEEIKNVSNISKSSLKRSSLPKFSSDTKSMLFLVLYLSLFLVSP